ncbi:MAG: EF-P beta-lysylation protein EpmB, partial [Proteobacteria bacterium]
MQKQWQKQLKRALNGQSANQLRQHTDYSESGNDLFHTVITDEITTAVNQAGNPKAIVRQFLPIAAETEISEDYHHDPVGDLDALAQQGIIHKYHGRVLLVVSGSCAVNCRYCFRRHFPYQQHLASRHNWQTVINYLAKHPEVHEVILSGGDPLTLKTDHLQSLTDQLSDLAHIKTLRIHSRMATVLPDRIDADFLAWLDSLPFHKVMVTHINHADELTNQAKNSLKRLKQHQVTLLNQSVLLKQVNDDADVLIELSHALFSQGVLPYYLHLFDRVQNAAHFDVNLSQAQQIYEKMRRHLPGYLLPKLVREESGQMAKTPV